MGLFGSAGKAGYYGQDVMKSFVLEFVTVLMAAVYAADWIRWKRKHAWRVWSSNLMTAAESERILRIIAASKAA
jgi:hypothetical protein